MHPDQKPTHRGEVAGEKVHRAPGTPPGPGELPPIKLPQEELAQLRAHFKLAGAEVSQRIRSHELIAPKELLPLIEALTALNFPVAAATSGFESTGHPRYPGFPTVTIREPARPFELRFHGHREAFATELKEIPVPLELRFRNILLLGLAPLTPELCSIVLTPDNERRYPKFFAAVEHAYDSATAETRYNTPTEDEALRRECNIALALRMKRYLEEFKENYRASPGVPITLEGRPGEPITLIAGNPHEQDPATRTTGTDSLRARIITERLNGFLALGSFLKDRALAGG